MLSYDIEHVTFGHGGTLHGKQAKEALDEAYSWLGKPQEKLSWTEKIGLGVLYLNAFQIPELVFEAGWKRILSEFPSFSKKSK